MFTPANHPVFMKRSTKVFFAAILLFVTTALASQPPKVVRSGWYPWDPYQYTVVKHDVKRLTGLDVQLVRTAFEQMGYEVVCDEVGWAQHQLDVKIGSRDIAAGVFQNAERAGYAYYSAPYRKETDMLYVRKADAERWRFTDDKDLVRQWRRSRVTWESLTGFTTARL
jgi:polar amino acid transport system substrate-binding protein